MEETLATLAVRTLRTTAAIGAVLAIAVLIGVDALDMNVDFANRGAIFKSSTSGQRHTTDGTGITSAEQELRQATARSAAQDRARTAAVVGIAAGGAIWWAAPVLARRAGKPPAHQNNSGEGGARG